MDLRSLYRPVLYSFGMGRLQGTRRPCIPRHLTGRHQCHGIPILLGQELRLLLFVSQNQCLDKKKRHLRLFRLLYPQGLEKALFCPGSSTDHCLSHGLFVAQVCMEHPIWQLSSQPKLGRLR